MQGQEADRRRRLRADVLAGRMTRRAVREPGMALGLSSSAITAMLVACGSGGSDEEESSPTATSATAGGGDGGAMSGSASPTTGGDGRAASPTDVPRKRTLIVMADDGNGQSPNFDNVNLYVTGSDCHGGRLQATGYTKIGWLSQDHPYGIPHPTRREMMKRMISVKPAH